MYIYIIIFALIVGYSIKEEFFNDINILSNIELRNVLLNNNDNYYDRFTNLDLAVRNVRSIREYKEKIFNSPINIDYELKDIIIKACTLINSIFKKYNTDGFYGEKAANIVWNIGIVDGIDYENGLPHTRNNVIIIPKHIIRSPRLINTLIHEKIHIYQKKYPEDIQIYLEKHKFKKIDNINRKYIRANPDITTDMYVNQDNKLFVSQYNHNPSNVSDVTTFPINEDKYEHPLEYMAYTLEKDISKMI